MKVCPLCSSSYEDWIDFCFNDGEPLVAEAVEPPPVPPLGSALDAPEPPPSRLPPPSVITPFTGRAPELDAPPAAGLPSSASAGASPAPSQVSAQVSAQVGPPPPPVVAAPPAPSPSAALPNGSPSPASPPSGAAAAGSPTASPAEARVTWEPDETAPMPVAPPRATGAPEEPPVLGSLAPPEAPGDSPGVAPGPNGAAPAVEDGYEDIAAALRSAAPTPPAPPRPTPVVRPPPTLPPPEDPFAEPPPAPSRGGSTFLLVAAAGIVVGLMAVAGGVYWVTRDDEVPVAGVEAPIASTVSPAGAEPGTAVATAAPPEAPPSPVDPVVPTPPEPAPASTAVAAASPAGATAAAPAATRPVTPAPVASATPTASGTASTAASGASARPPATGAPASGTQVAAASPATAATAAPGSTTAATPATTTPATTSAPAEKPTGMLRVVSQPDGGTVYVDNVTHGKTPASVSLAHGSYTVRVVLEGYKPASSVVSLASAEETVSVKLEPDVITGQVNVFGPPGFQLTVDGQSRGTLPVTIPALSEGAHEFVVSAAGGPTCRSSKDVRFSERGRPFTVSLQCP